MTGPRASTSAHAPLELVSALPATLCTFLGDACVVSLATGSGGSVRPVAVGHCEPAAAAALEALMHTDPNALGSAFADRALETGGSVWMPVVSSSLMRLWTPPGFWDYLSQHPVHSLLVAALVAGGQVAGLVSVWRERAGPAFDVHDDAFLRNFADRLAPLLTTVRPRRRAQPAQAGRPRLRLVPP
jgi:hypothetical protein